MDIRPLIQQSIEVKSLLLIEPYPKEIEEIGQVLFDVLERGRMLLIAGNGGSAADAQHFAGELVGRFSFDRPGLPAMALTSNSSILTAVSNDIAFDHVFSRSIEAFGKKGDVFIAISTSGNSGSIMDALRVAKSREMITIGLLGKGGGRAKSLCDYTLVVPSDNTQAIQEAHIMIIHIWCAYIDDRLQS